MTESRQLHIGPLAAVAATLSILLAGAGGMYFAMRQSRVPDSSHATPPAGTTSATSRVPATLPDVVVTLSKEAADRAGISVTQIAAQTVIDNLRVPGVVEPNAYRQVSVTPLVAGRVIKVSVQLGDRVRKGQSIAQVYSPELAEARTKYVAAKAMLDAHDRELQRTQKLVEIGAASRQELERIHAEHAAQTAELESARARLRLLGADAETKTSDTQESATTTVVAPIDGIVTERLANAGVNVDPATKLLTIVDLSNVWIVADVYERDLQRVREGQRAIVTTTAYPDQRLEGRVSFIDPQLNAATRTAKIRIEVANPRADLRLGMYTDVGIESASLTSVLVVPKEAVQSVGERQVVYLSSANAPDRFVEREVRLGRSFGKQVEVLGGVNAGDSVVSAGSFYVRAEAERLGLRGRAATPNSGAPTAKVTVTEKGFEPDAVKLRANIPARITFIRTTDKTCATEVVFPSMGIKRALPLNEEVAIEFTPEKTGTIAFVCGMNMLKGAVVVE
jgi:RND family efflux transporter MFP subunit